MGRLWTPNAAAWYLDIESDATVAGSAAGSVDIDPAVVMAGIGYRFQAALDTKRPGTW
ncbi:OmpW family outer membrane protein [Halomonas sp. HNIBRBA4712]|uniref:OmpW family outer membrane protein n=1 Tax=Halomonas sp. HNIBRBA4712 TaxID=3373087 RepID=UPI0037465567